MYVCIDFISDPCCPSAQGRLSIHRDQHCSVKLEVANAKHL